MNINDIAMEVNEVIRWGVLGLSGYLLAIGALNTIPSMIGYSKRIKTFDELNKVIDGEAKKLSLDPKKFRRRYTNANDGEGLSGCATQLSDEVYGIAIPRNFGCDRKTVRPELVHIANGDQNHGRGYYYFVGEPRACLYGTFGIRI
jgi:hypothetical protein